MWYGIGSLIKQFGHWTLDTGQWTRDTVHMKKNVFPYRCNLQLMSYRMINGEWVMGHLRHVANGDTIVNGTCNMWIKWNEIWTLDTGH